MNKINLEFTLNQQKVSCESYSMNRALDLLREDLHCTGIKEGCGEGECGACSILLNGKLVNSCLIPAMELDGAEVVSIEGLCQAETLNSIQSAFHQYGGAQCGICTPGMIVAAKDLLNKNPHPSREDVRTALAGNLCRCTGYMKIFDSVLAACQKEMNS